MELIWPCIKMQLAAILNKSFCIKQHIGKKHNFSLWGIAITMSTFAQSESTIVCHSQACLHVHQSVYSSASCRAVWSSNTYLQIFKSTVGWSFYSFALMQAHTHPQMHAHTHTHLALTCRNTLPCQKCHIPILSQIYKICCWEAPHLVCSHEPVNTFSNVFTIHNNPVAKHISKSSVYLSVFLKPEELVFQTVRKWAGAKRERTKKGWHCEFWLSRNIFFSFLKADQLQLLFLGYFQKQWTR